MKGSHVFVLVAVIGMAAAFGLGVAVGQQSPPALNKGLDAKLESTIDLAPDFPGYQLRLRTVTLEPGGVAGFHTHRQRPAFSYVLHGTVTELREGGYVKVVAPGGFITESRKVEHWEENRGTTKVVILGIDIVKP